MRTRSRAGFPAMLSLTIGLSWSIPPAAASPEQSARAETTRYFAVWSYAENAPREELDPATLADRTLGWWELIFDGEDRTLRGIYHAPSGTAWLSFRYVEADRRIYADLYSASGRLLSRKTTLLDDRAPHWPAGRDRPNPDDAANEAQNSDSSETSDEESTRTASPRSF